MKKQLLTAGVVVGLCSATAAVAQQDRAGELLSRSYVGISAGAADFDDPAAIGNIGAGAIKTGEDDSDTAWKIFAGYRLSDVLAVEAAWNDLGETTFKGELLGQPVTAKTELSGLSAFAVGTWPVGNQFNVFGKAGFLWWDSEGTSNVADPDDDGVDVGIGVGANYAFTQQLSLRGEWEWYNDVAGSDISVLSVGVSLGF